MSVKRCIVVAALVAASGSAAAQDSKLTVELDQFVISSGETVGVRVDAQFPTSAFALARVDLDLFAPAPVWRSGSSGVLAGDAVLGAFFEQIHNPFGGPQADPTNPMRIWSGHYRPDVVGPTLLKIDAKPTSLSYYPSPLTASTVPGNPLPGRNYLWVDPVHIPNLGQVAPGEGTTMQVDNNGLVIAESEEDAILIGLLLPAVQKVREAGVRMETLAAPTKATPKLMLACATGTYYHSEEVSFNFTKMEMPSRPNPLYELDVEATFAAEVEICFLGTNGQRICLPGGAAPIRFDPLPLCLKFEIIEDKLFGSTTVVGTTCGGQPIHVSVPGVFEGLTTEPIEVRIMPAFMKYEGIEGSCVEMSGLPRGAAGRVAIEFSAPCAADFDGSGELDIFDFLAFQNAFASGDMRADFDRNGRLNIFDFLAFQNAFAAGCR